MHIEFLIIGQGISGTWLSYYLQKQGRSFHVIDNGDGAASSRLAAGVINPVTGRRHVEAWMADTLIPFASEAYRQIGRELNIDAISTTSIVDFFPTAQMRHSFMQRVEEKPRHLFEFPDIDPYHPILHFEFGAGEIRPVYLVNLEKLLPAWRVQLKKNNQLSELFFNPGELAVENGKIKYREFSADYIIFCDGYQSGAHSFFRLLPFAPNKGEILVAEIDNLPTKHIYKKGMMMVPLSTPGLWWIGSDYKWEFDDSLPTQEFRDKTGSLLKNWLKMPFKIVDHLAGIRPATIERRPFVGLHPLFPNIGILNGMGTKGCSLAPFFAKQLSDHLCFNQPLMPEADVRRFTKILSK